MKRRLISFRRVIKTGLQNFVRNAWLSIAATLVMVVALSISMASFVLNIAAQNAIKELSKDIKISIYLQDGVTEQDRSKLKKALESNRAVAQVDYISRDEATSRLKEQQDQGFVDQTLALLGTSALPESFDVSVNDLDKLDEVAQIAKGKEFEKIVGQNKDDITLGKTRSRETVERASTIKRTITLSTIIAASFFGVISMLIIFNTIRMAIFSRAEEIKIMKLIGATPSYIRGPFIIEASLYGFIAGVLSSGIIAAVLIIFGERIANQREFNKTYLFFTESNVLLMMAGASILIGVMVGVLSSGLAMRKHLRLKRW